MTSPANNIEILTDYVSALHQFRATGSGPIAATLTVDENIIIRSIAIHLSAAGGTAENLVVAIDSDAGAAYDTNLIVQDMETVADIFDNEQRHIPAGDDIDITYANTNSRTWGVTIQYAKVGT